MVGLLLYVYNPVIDYLDATFPTSGIYAQAMFFIWGAIAVVNLFRAGISFIMQMQKQQ